MPSEPSTASTRLALHRMDLSFLLLCLSPKAFPLLSVTKGRPGAWRSRRPSSHGFRGGARECGAPVPEGCGGRGPQGPVQAWSLVLGRGEGSRVQQQQGVCHGGSFRPLPRLLLPSILWQHQIVWTLVAPMSSLLLLL